MVLRPRGFSGRKGIDVRIQSVKPSNQSVSKRTFNERPEVEFSLVSQEINRGIGWWYIQIGVEWVNIGQAREAVQDSIELAAKM